MPSTARSPFFRLLHGISEEIKCGNLRYGCNYYDYQEGTLVFLAPGQVIGVEDDGKVYQPQGMALVFHPDLLRGTTLGRTIKDYTFFSYQVNEALHLSEHPFELEHFTTPFLLSAEIKIKIYLTADQIR